MRIFAGVPLGGASNEWSCRRRQFLAIWVATSLGGYVFGNVRHKTSSITWRYATHCRPV